MSGDPINKIDPNGDDDYFNAKGQFIRSTKTGSKIYVHTAEGVALLAKVNLTTRANQQAVANVVGYYAPKAGIDMSVGKVGLGVTDNAIAFNAGLDIRVNWRGGKIDEGLSDRNFLINVLVHEDLHKKDHMKKVSGDNYMTHANVYLGQMKHSSFKEIDEKKQVGLARAFAIRLMNHFAKDATDGGEEFNKVLDDFNKNNTGGITLRFHKMEYHDPTFYNVDIYKNGKIKGNAKYEDIDKGTH